MNPLQNRSKERSRARAGTSLSPTFPGPRRRFSLCHRRSRFGSSLPGGNRWLTVSRLTIPSDQKLQDSQTYLTVPGQSGILHLQLQEVLLLLPPLSKLWMLDDRLRTLSPEERFQPAGSVVTVHHCGHLSTDARKTSARSCLPLYRLRSTESQIGKVCRGR